MNVRLTHGKTHELDPKKAYLLFLKANAFGEEEVKKLQAEFKKLGITNVLAVLAQKGSYKLVEAKQAEAKLKKEAVEQVKAVAKKATKK